jgi:predicted O-methyltransferase YrrM
MQTANSPIIFKHGSIQWLDQIQLSAFDLLKLSSTPKTINNLLETLNQISSDNYLEYMIAYYQKGLSTFGEAWSYCDLLMTLQATTSILKPTHYLEIGVRRGRSLAVVAKAHPPVNIYGFDLWVKDYAGMENPGPDFVKNELKKVEHQGKLELISGDSRKTIPYFFKNNPQLYFDMITVDGDHSEKGAKIDLQNVLPHLKIGGIILLDDICHPQHIYLEKLWDKMIGNNKNFISAKYTDIGYGIAFAIRRKF